MPRGPQAFVARAVARWFSITLPPLILAGCLAAAPPPPKIAEQPTIAPLAAADLRSLTPQEKAVLAKTFAAGLKDPTSAIFQWTKVPKKLPDDGFDYCGTVNAKNSYGGYTGAVPFIGLILVGKGKIAGGVIAATGDIRPEYSQIIPDMCRKKGLDPFAVSEG